MNILESILKVGCKFWDLLFPLLNFERSLGFKEGYNIGPTILNHVLTYARLAWPTHPT